MLEFDVFSVLIALYDFHAVTYYRITEISMLCVVMVRTMMAVLNDIMVFICYG